MDSRPHQPDPNRPPGPGRDYYDKKIAEGKTKSKATRCLKRHLARTVYRCLQADHSPTVQAAA